MFILFYKTKPLKFCCVVCTWESNLCKLSLTKICHDEKSVIVTGLASILWHPLHVWVFITNNFFHIFDFTQVLIDIDLWLLNPTENHINKMYTTKKFAKLKLTSFCLIYNQHRESNKKMQVSSVYIFGFSNHGQILNSRHINGSLL